MTESNSPISYHLPQIKMSGGLSSLSIFAQMTQDERISMKDRLQFYLEKTFSQHPSDVAHLLKYLYYPIIRFDTKHWYYFVDHHWTRRDEDNSPLMSLMKNDLVNKYLSLANDYNQQVMKLNNILGEVENNDDKISLEGLVSPNDLKNSNTLNNEKKFQNNNDNTSNINYNNNNDNNSDSDKNIHNNIDNNFDNNFDNTSDSNSNTNSDSNTNNSLEENNTSSSSSSEYYGLQSPKIYFPLLISDLMYKSKICSELSLRLSNRSFFHKVNLVAQELFTQNDFSLKLDLNPYLIGFNNGNYDLINKKLKVPEESDRVFMTVGYHFRPDRNIYKREIIEWFKSINLYNMLPQLAYLINGTTRQPMIWVDGLDRSTKYSISKLLEWTFGDYIGSLSFSTLRKRKIPHYQNHTHAELVESCKKRIIMIDQEQDDYPNVYTPMIDILLDRTTLNLRKPYENNNHYVPQFGIIVLSSKSDSEPHQDAIIFKANTNNSTKNNYSSNNSSNNSSNKSSNNSSNKSSNNSSNNDDSTKHHATKDDKDDQINNDSNENQFNSIKDIVKEEWKYDFIKLLFEFI
tara:strand:- start:3625 stop:5343 length:1719 start_codon:yes stop_codon:yes gene_type:complete